MRGERRSRQRQLRTCVSGLRHQLRAAVCLCVPGRVNFRAPHRRHHEPGQKARSFELAVQKRKSVQHSAFPSGPPRQYYLSSPTLSFRGVNGTGARVGIWSYTPVVRSRAVPEGSGAETVRAPARAHRHGKRASRAGLGAERKSGWERRDERECVEKRERVSTTPSDARRDSEDGADETKKRDV